MMNKSSSVTALLQQIAEGDGDVQEKLFRAVEDELRLIAQARMRGERPDHTLQTTVLVDDAFVRLIVDTERGHWQNRQHFYRAAAKAMQNILVDYARQYRAAKRGAGQPALAQNDLDWIAISINVDEVLEVNDVLEKFAGIDPRAAEVVKLRYFAGRTIEETARLLGISERTAKNDWKAARAFLHMELGHD